MPVPEVTVSGAGGGHPFLKNKENETMILICTKKCFLFDRSVKPGQPLDIPETMLNSDIVKSSFAKPETVEAAKKAEQSAAAIEANAELSYDELKRRLDEIGVAYKGNASKEALKNILAAQLAAKPGEA